MRPRLSLPLPRDRHGARGRLVLLCLRRGPPRGPNATRWLTPKNTTRSSRGGPRGAHISRRQKNEPPTPSSSFGGFGSEPLPFLVTLADEALRDEDYWQSQVDILCQMVSLLHTLVLRCAWSCLVLPSCRGLAAPSTERLQTHTRQVRIHAMTLQPEAERNQPTPRFASMACGPPPK